MRHYLFLAFAATTWFALYIALFVLLGQIMEWVSAHYAPVPEDQALLDLRKRLEENRRQSRVSRLEAVWDEAQSIIKEEETAREASRIIAKLDENAEQDWAAEVELAQAVLELRADAERRLAVEKKKSA